MESEFFYQIVVRMEPEPEGKAKPKPIRHITIIKASNAIEAGLVVQESFKSYNFNWRIVTINETKISEVLD